MIPWGKTSVSRNSNDKTYTNKIHEIGWKSSPPLSTRVAGLATPLAVFVSFWATCTCRLGQRDPKPPFDLGRITAGLLYRSATDLLASIGIANAGAGPRAAATLADGPASLAYLAYSTSRFVLQPRRREQCGPRRPPDWSSGSGFVGFRRAEKTRGHCRRAACARHPTARVGNPETIVDKCNSRRLCPSAGVRGWWSQQTSDAVPVRSS